MPGGSARTPNADGMIEREEGAQGAAAMVSQRHCRDGDRMAHGTRPRSGRGMRKVSHPFEDAWITQRQAVVIVALAHLHCARASVSRTFPVRVIAGDEERLRASAANRKPPSQSDPRKSVAMGDA